MNIEIQVALINGGAMVIAAIITSIVAALIGRKFLNEQKLKNLVITAAKDIEFLLVVERHHIEEHKAEGDNTGYKNTMRDKAREEGYTWSGVFVPSGSARIINDLTI